MFTPFTAIAYPSAAFITRLCRTTLQDSPWLNLTEIRFDIQQFENTLFACYHIREPAHLHRAVKKRRAEYLASRYAARVALASAGIADFLLENDSDRAPVWPPGVLGSLTHSANRAVVITAAAAPQRRIGVDAEQLISESAAAGLSEMILSLSERHYLAQIAIPFPQALTLCFSLKESLYKALYPELRQFMDFHSAEVTELAPETGRASLRLTRRFGAEFPAGRQFTGYFHQQGHEVLTLVIDEQR